MAVGSSDFLKSIYADSFLILVSKPTDLQKIMSILEWGNIGSVEIMSGS